MGWLFMYGLDGHAGPKQYLDAQATYEREHLKSRVLRSALVRMCVYYAAVEHITHDGERTVWGLICLVKYNPRHRNGETFGYKEMSEDMGPCENECPQAILDLLTETKAEYAIEWRARCQKTLTIRKSNAAKPRLQPGQTIEFATPIHFTDGSQHQRFDVIPSFGNTRSVRLRAAGSSSTYRINNIKRMTYQVIDTPPR